LQKSVIVKAVFINLFDILPKYICQAKYPAGYPLSGFWICWKSGKNLRDMFNRILKGQSHEKIG
jgi:hypothetical protein